MTAAAVPAQAAPPAKGGSKTKLIVIALAALALLGAGAGGGFWFLQKQKGHAEEPAAHAAPTQPPAFLPLESMVVNLADPGGERMVQLGITVQLADEKAAERVKAFMPSVRSAVLLLVSQRTSAELLQRDGKERLALAIAAEVARPLGIEPEEAEQAAEAGKEPSAQASAPPKKRKPRPQVVNPVQGVLFSSFIIQ